MNTVRAVICDVYRTILEVLPEPADADARWSELAIRYLGSVSHPLRELSDRCREVVAIDHAEAKARGVVFPEVVWPEVLARALPGFSRLDDAAREEFVFEHMQLLRGLRLMSGAADFLRECVRREIPLGIASNAQRYTLRELAGGLASARLDAGIFDPDLVVWSWQLGFSKPNPHVFRILTARLEYRGIRPEEILMIGDRLDNDIEPARMFGWQTAHIADESGWRELSATLGSWTDKFEVGRAEARPSK